jgi:hypothetical protein
MGEKYDKKTIRTHIKNSRKNKEKDNEKDMSICQELSINILWHVGRKLYNIFYFSLTAFLFFVTASWTKK